MRIKAAPQARDLSQPKSPKMTAVGGSTVKVEASTSKCSHQARSESAHSKVKRFRLLSQPSGWMLDDVGECW